MKNRETNKKTTISKAIKTKYGVFIPDYRKYLVGNLNKIVEREQRKYKNFSIQNLEQVMLENKVTGLMLFAFLILAYFFLFGVWSNLTSGFWLDVGIGALTCLAGLITLALTYSWHMIKQAIIELILRREGKIKK